jgi:hypothetical protein
MQFRAEAASIVSPGEISKPALFKTEQNFATFVESDFLEVAVRSKGLSSALAPRFSGFCEYLLDVAVFERTNVFCAFQNDT